MTFIHRSLSLSRIWLLLFGLFLPQISPAYIALNSQVRLEIASTKPAKKDRYVSYFEYQGVSVPKQRTPEKKLKGGGAIMVRELEDLMEQGYHSLLASEIQPIYTREQQSRIELVQLQVEKARPKWNHEAYRLEYAFYQQQDELRQQRREEIARQELAREQLRIRRVQRAADSTARVRLYLLRVRQDSLVAVAARQQALTDSLALVAEAEASPYRFVNATKLNLRSSPSTTSTAQVAVRLGSSVEVLKRLANGWWNVSVEGYEGYLRSEYLVSSIQNITVPGANLTELAECENCSFVERIPILPQARGKRRIYICGGQYAYAYHATNSCSGLNNCRGGVYYTTEGKAQNMGRTPCGRCFY